MLRLTELSKRYDAVAALDGLSFTARPGRLLGFLGPNGAGKTTAMRAVFGLVRPDQGEVTWQERRITASDLHRFGYMPEQRGMYPRMAAGPQLSYFAQLHGMASGRADEAARRWLDELGLGDRHDSALSSLSHGNQQRVQLAAALVHDPELLVLDEPFNGLDPLGVDAMSRVLRERAEGGATVVFSSHQLDLVEGLCDDVVIIAAGRDRVAGTLAEVREAATHRRVEVRVTGVVATAPPTAEVDEERDGLVRMTVPADTDPVQMLAGLARQGTVERFSFEPPTLSEIFKDVVGVSLREAEAEATDTAEVPA
jgi:ABC-2 type transport system ATP-binding protein